jgi:phosphate/sulfate permease
MKKNNFWLWKRFSGTWISSFFSNLLSVIIGITITFGISFLVEQHKDKSQMREMINLVQKELKANKEWFEAQDTLIAHQISTFKILLDNEENHWKNIPSDSLVLLIEELHTISFSYSSTNSWDLFRSSEIFQKFPNKDLLNVLSQCYFYTETIRHEIIEERYYEEIEKSIADIYESDRNNPSVFMESLMKSKKAKFCLRESIIAKDKYHDIFIVACAAIDMTLDVIKDSGHNFRELDKDYEFEVEFGKYLEKYKSEKSL